MRGMSGMVGMTGVKETNGTHSSHNATGPPKEAGRGHAMDGGMEGMEEMGIFTTNFAWDMPENKTATNATNGFSFGSKGPESVNPGKADSDAKKSLSTAPGLKEENPSASFPSTQLPFGAISPQTLAAQQAAAAQRERDYANWAGIWAGFLTATGLNALFAGKPAAANATSNATVALVPQKPTTAVPAVVPALQQSMAVVPVPQKSTVLAAAASSSSPSKAKAN
jgi:hypothetical protein